MIIEIITRMIFLATLFAIAIGAGMALSRMEKNIKDNGTDI